MKSITHCEKEVLYHLCQGLTSKEIAAQLYKSPYTIDSHRKKLYEKLEAKTGVELGVKAMQYGLLPDLVCL